MVGLCLKFTHNYGSCLQTFSFLHFLSLNNVEYKIISYEKKYSLIDYVKSLPRLFNIIWINDKMEANNKKKGLRHNPKVAQQVQIREKCIAKFIEEEFYPYVINITGYKNLERLSKQFKIVLSGSDQLLSPAALGSHFYTLEFCDSNVKRVSYASSFGTRYIPWYQRNRTKKYLKQFASFSVREKSGIDIVQKLAGITPSLVLDPVFLLNREQWLEYIRDYLPITKEKYVFAYFLSGNFSYRKIVEQFAIKNNLKIVTLHHLDQYVDSDEKFGDFYPYNVSPMQFLSLLNNAAFVCTDSFHGTSFSIILHKQFMSFYRYSINSKFSKNTRIDSLLNIAHLENRLFLGNISNILRPINYSEVDNYLFLKIEESKKYLLEVVKNDKDN